MVSLVNLTSVKTTTRWGRKWEVVASKIHFKEVVATVASTGRTNGKAKINPASSRHKGTLVTRTDMAMNIIHLVVRTQGNSSKSSLRKTMKDLKEWRKSRTGGALEGELSRLRSLLGILNGIRNNIGMNRKKLKSFIGNSGRRGGRENKNSFMILILQTHSIWRKRSRDLIRRMPLSPPYELSGGPYSTVFVSLHYSELCLAGEGNRSWSWKTTWGSNKHMNSWVGPTHSQKCIDTFSHHSSKEKTWNRLEHGTRNNNKVLRTCHLFTTQTRIRLVWIKEFHHI